MKLLPQSRQRRAGLTFVELLLAVLILSIGIVGTLLLFSNSILSSEYAWDVTTATSHADSLLEEMQSRASLNEITATDWNQWAVAHSLNVLPEEKIEVKFDDKQSNPLDIIVQINWKRKDRASHVVFKTKMTK